MYLNVNNALCTCLLVYKCILLVNNVRSIYVLTCILMLIT
ncbi:unnamed protein product, partial [Arabidopsis halleri]